MQFSSCNGMIIKEQQIYIYYYKYYKMSFKQLSETRSVLISNRLQTIQAIQDKTNKYNSFMQLSTESRQDSPPLKKKLNFNKRLLRDRPLYKSLAEVRRKSETKKQNKSQSLNKNLFSSSELSKSNNKNIKRQIISLDQRHLQFIKSKFIKKGGDISNDKAILLQQIQQKTSNFNKLCKENKYKSALDILIIFLNYTIDLNLIKEFIITLLHISHFLLLTKDFQKCIYYYNQTRICAKFMLFYNLLIDSLIGISKCCYEINLNKQAIIFLKKGLEFTWIVENSEKELVVYDLIGMNYYKLGDLSRSKSFHERYIEGIIEPPQSSIKIFVKSKMRQQQKVSKIKILNKIDARFLIRLNIPVLSINILPMISTNSRIREQYFNEVQNKNQSINHINSQIERYLEESEFRDIVPQQMYKRSRYAQIIQQKADIYQQIKSQLNMKLKSIEKRKNIKLNKMNVNFKHKLDLDEKIEIRLNQKKLQRDWYENILQQILRDKAYNLDSSKDHILIKRGKEDQQYHNSSFELFKLFFHTYYIQILKYTDV